MNEEKDHAKSNAMQHDDGASSTVNTTTEGSSRHGEADGKSPTSVLCPLREATPRKSTSNDDSCARNVKGRSTGQWRRPPQRPSDSPSGEPYAISKRCDVSRHFTSLRSGDIVQQLESLLIEARQLLTVHSSLRRNHHVVINKLVDKINELSKTNDIGVKAGTDCAALVESNRQVQAYLLEIRAILIELNATKPQAVQEERKRGSKLADTQIDASQKQRATMARCLLGIEQTRVESLELALELCTDRLRYTKNSYETLCKVHAIEMRALREHHDDVVTMLQRGMDSKDQLITSLTERVNAAADPVASGVVALKNETIRRKDRRIEVLQHELKRHEIDLAVAKREKQIAQECFEREAAATAMMYEELLEQLRKEVRVRHDDEASLTDKLRRTQEKLKYVQKQNLFERKTAVARDWDHKRALAELEKSRNSASRDLRKELKARDEEVKQLNDRIKRMEAKMRVKTQLA